MSTSPTSTDAPQAGKTAYRAFRLSHNGAVQSAEIIWADSDDKAKAIAAMLINGHGIDLWEQARFLASYPPLAASRGGV